MLAMAQHAAKAKSEAEDMRVRCRTAFRGEFRTFVLRGAWMMNVTIDTYAPHAKRVVFEFHCHGIEESQ